VLLTAVLAWLLLGEQLTGRDFLASTIVMGAIYMYYTAPVAPPPPPPPINAEDGPMDGDSGPLMTRKL
jgi:hypothetical protein